MRFRRIYWVTEKLFEDGHSEVAGIYTSIPDLIDVGLQNSGKDFRLNLCELDCPSAPLLCLEKPEFSSLVEKLSPMIKDGEFSSEDVSRLSQALNSK